MWARIPKLRIYQVLCTILFGLALVGLPLTSFPLLRRLTGSMVAPFSALPLAGLILIWLVPYLRRQGTFPKEFVSIFYFALVAVIVSAGAYFLDGFFLRGRTFFDQSLRALLTLAIGLSFYITLTAYMHNKHIIRQAVQFIYLGGILIILWSGIEIILLRTYGNAANFPVWVTNLKSGLVHQQPSVLLLDRLTGFTYEPSWYVLIYNFVLFPLWLSAIFQRKSVFTFRLWVFQIEDFLFIAGVTVFIFSFPRIGLLALMVMLAYFGFMLVKRAYFSLHRWLINHKKFTLKNTALLRVTLAAILVIIILTAIGSAAGIFIQFASERDYRYQLLIDQVLTQNPRDLPTSETDIILLARQLAFLERTVYWFAGWNIFADYPFGVGLGNAGFYMIDRINSVGYGSYEVRNLLFQADHLINTKSFWVRLLAETGLIGFSLYLTWLYLLWRNSTLIQKSRHSLLKIIGMAGHFFILAHLVEGFSVDSFAFPYPWVTASLISASSLVVRKEMVNSEW
jgi:hypothetical protein